MCLTLRCHVEPKIARPSSSYVQSSGYVLLGSHVYIGTSHQALQLAQAPPWRRYGMGRAPFSDEEPTTGNSYYEKRTRRSGQRCPPTPPATRANLVCGKYHTDSMAADNARTGEFRGIGSTHRQKARPLLVSLEVGGLSMKELARRVMPEIQEVIASARPPCSPITFSSRCSPFSSS